MQAYANLGGDSGVSAYEIGPTSIKVRFTTGATYLYNHAAPGKAAVDGMKALAQAGRGLNAYITRHVGKNFASKLV